MSSSGFSSQRKRQTFAEAFDPKENAFAFLRMFLALLVVVSHCYPVGRFGTEPLEAITAGRHSLGEVAVAMFFVLSGFLITRSCAGSSSIGRFLWHRFLRIFPGYWVCLLVTAFVFAPLFAFIGHGVFWRVFSAPWDSPQSYVIGNALMFHLNGLSVAGVMNLEPASIAHLVSQSPYPWSINGSLWSLPYEVTCYLAVAGLSLAGVLSRGRLLVVALSVCLWILYATRCLNPEYFQACFPSRCFDSLVLLGLYFSAGCACYLYRGEIPVSNGLLAASILLLGVGLTVGAFGLVAPLAMTYLFIYGAFRLPIRRFDARGDFSYGTYIYAFPIQQGLVLLGVNQGGFVLYLIWSILATLILAVLSYRWIEAPCLTLKGFNPAAFSTRFSRRTQSVSCVTTIH